jgi:hypothetical protein
VEFIENPKVVVGRLPCNLIEPFLRIARGELEDNQTWCIHQEFHFWPTILFKLTLFKHLEHIIPVMPIIITVPDNAKAKTYEDTLHMQ